MNKEAQTIYDERKILETSMLISYIVILTLGSDVIEFSSITTLYFPQ